MPSLRNCIKSIPAMECSLNFFSPPPSFLFFLFFCSFFFFFLLNYLKMQLLILSRLVLKLKQLARNTLLVFVLISALCYTRQLEQPVAESLTTC